jgi:hypothetical protein
MSSKIINYLRAGFSAFWLKTSEHDHVRQTVYSEIKAFQRKDGNHYNVIEWTLGTADPMGALNGFNDAPDFSVMFLYNWHWFSDKPQVVQIIKDNLKVWSNHGKAIVCVSHTNKIPAELDKEFTLIELPLPEETEIKNAIQNFLSDRALESQELSRVANSCKGLSRIELENVLALSLIENEGAGFSIDSINQHKKQAIKKSGFLDVLDGNLTFDDVVGYKNIKEFITETIDNPKAKGIMTIGPPGCGKTSLMKAIVGETKRFGLSVNMGSLFSKFQGETDQNINRAIEIISSIGDCIVLIDEFEKQFAGSQSDGSLDSGTTRRATGRWLDFLQNRPQGVYIVGTANSFDGIPNEYLRPGRWDTSPFFIDYPTRHVAKAILKHYCTKNNVKYQDMELNNFSGAEIEALVHIASMRGLTLKDAFPLILPQAKTCYESIERLRSWAKDRTIPAESLPVASVKTGRKIDT